jgi:hypothetical protein
MAGGRRSRDKGNRAERDIVESHKSLGLHAERYPLSGTSRFRGSGHGAFDAFFLRRNNADPLVVLPWKMWARILERVRR